MRKYPPLLLFSASLLFSISCRAPKSILYFENVSRDKQITEMYETYQKYVSYISPDDILGITVSNVDPLAVAAFNLPMMSYSEPNEKDVRILPSLQTYLVDKEGYITFPVIGQIKLGGLSKQEAIELLQSKISEYVDKPIVTINFINYKISVLGDVLRPGEYTLRNERTSVLNAIAMAGDLTINGDRKNVLLIRDNNGSIETHRFDLTSSELFEDPYYYLRQNDIIYIEPNKAKQRMAHYSQANQFNVSIISTIISASSIIVSLSIAIKSMNR